MKRSPELAILSREHHVLLEHALRLRRCEPATAGPAIRRLADCLATDGGEHFDAEERVLVPALRDAGQAVLAERLMREHADLLRRTRQVLRRPDDLTGAHALGDLLAAHVRFEERELFGWLERRLGAAGLAAVGDRLEAAAAA